MVKPLKSADVATVVIISVLDEQYILMSLVHGNKSAF